MRQPSVVFTFTLRLCCHLHYLPCLCWTQHPWLLHRLCPHFQSMKTRKFCEALVAHYVVAHIWIFDIDFFYWRSSLEIYQISENLHLFNSWSMHKQAKKYHQRYMDAWRSNWNTLYLPDLEAKRRRKILGQPSKALPYNSGLYKLLINIQILFSLQTGSYSWGLTFKGACNRSGLYV